MLKTQTHEQTQREVIEHFDAAHETAAQKQAEYTAKRCCEHTHRIMNIAAGVETTNFTQTNENSLWI
jgi:predicted glycosyl hydrolase (DUF1957 family)